MCSAAFLFFFSLSCLLTSSVLFFSFFYLEHLVRILHFSFICLPICLLCIHSLSSTHSLGNISFSISTPFLFFIFLFNYVFIEAFCFRSVFIYFIRFCLFFSVLLPFFCSLCFHLSFSLSFSFTRFSFRFFRSSFIHLFISVAALIFVLSVVPLFIYFWRLFLSVFLSLYLD